MKPAFQTLWQNYPDADKWKRKQLFRSIGWDNLIDDPGYRNTCAIRLSIALLKSGVPISSSAGMKVLKGAMKGRPIEIRQEKLSHQLRRLWGKPKILPKKKPENVIGDRNGVVSFFRLPVYWGARGGHIDLVDGRSFTTVPFLYFWKRMVDLPSECRVSCHWNAAEVWFWELP